MRLFISNFKQHFIFRTMMAFFAISICYYTAVSHMNKDLKGVSQRQTNILKAQAYCFAEKYYSVVLLGSSELCGVPLEELSGNVFNLAFAGGTASTGMDILMHQKQLPDVLFIELNDTIIRPVDADILQVLSPWHALPWERENNRPDYILRYLMAQIRNFFHPRTKKSFNQQIDFDALKLQQKEHQNLLDEEKLYEKSMELKSQVDALEQKGCRVILVEPPKDKSLLPLPQTKQVRRILQDVFPVDCYEWLITDWNEYNTADGIHLTDESSYRYAKYLLSYIE